MKRLILLILALSTTQVSAEPTDHLVKLAQNKAETEFSYDGITSKFEAFRSISEKPRDNFVFVLQCQQGRSGRLEIALGPKLTSIFNEQSAPTKVKVSTMGGNALFSSQGNISLLGEDVMLTMDLPTGQVSKLGRIMYDNAPFKISLEDNEKVGSIWFEPTFGEKGKPDLASLIRTCEIVDG